MLLLMAALLTIVSALIELFLVLKFAVVRKFVMRNAAFSLVFSIALSWVLGAMFGASGLVVLLASLGSTLITEPLYMAFRKFKQFRDSFADRWAALPAPTPA